MDRWYGTLPAVLVFGVEDGRTHSQWVMKQHQAHYVVCLVVYTVTTFVDQMRKSTDAGAVLNGVGILMVVLVHLGML